MAEEGLLLRVSFVLGGRKEDGGGGVLVICIY